MLTTLILFLAALVAYSVFTLVNLRSQLAHLSAFNARDLDKAQAFYCLPPKNTLPSSLGQYRPYCLHPLTPKDDQYFILPSFLFSTPNPKGVHLWMNSLPKKPLYLAYKPLLSLINYFRKRIYLKAQEQLALADLAALAQFEAKL